MILNYFQHADKEKLSGIALLVAALLALIINNSGFAYLYDALLTVPLSIKIGEFGIDKPLLLWINDGLMAVFFFLIGLEVKREILYGSLSNRKQAILPIIAALGGIVVPALIYISFNNGNDYALKGWAIPVATDIAFALGILALIGSKVPKELKVLLLSLAIIDDIAAIGIIGVFYSEKLSFDALLLSALGIAIAIGMNIKGVTKTAPYVLIGLFIWVCVLKSGVHATLAGVIIALCIPQRQDDCPAMELEHALIPWVYFFVMPLFAFANSGLSILNFTPDMITTGIPLGIIFGLFIGKQLGVFSFIWLSTKLKVCSLPDNVNWKQVYGLAVLTGIGFTMSLFIGTLAFESEIIETKVRLAILIASFLSGITGFILLKLFCKNN